MADQVQPDQAIDEEENKEEDPEADEIDIDLTDEQIDERMENAWDDEHFSAVQDGKHVWATVFAMPMDASR